MITRNEIKYVNSLFSKKGRKLTNQFVIEGPKMVDELLKSSLRPVKVFGTPDWYVSTGLKSDGFFQTVSESELSRLSNLETPNSVLAIVQIPRSTIESISFEDKGYVLFLDNIQDPGNLGTIIRLADWFGIKAVCLSESSADPFSPKAIQSSMGSILRVRVLRISWASLMEGFVQEKPALIGAVLGGKNAYKTPVPDSGIIVIGNESKGIAPEIVNQLNYKLEIPSAPASGAESLNAGIATAILVSELFRRNSEQF